MIGEFLGLFLPGVITGAALTVAILRPWRPKVTIESETDR